MDRFEDILRQVRSAITQEKSETRRIFINHFSFDIGKFSFDMAKAFEGGGP